MHFSILSDLKKTTVVVESLSTIQPDVLFQRLPAYFKKHGNCMMNTMMYSWEWDTSMTQSLLVKEAWNHTKYHLAAWHMCYRTMKKRIRNITRATNYSATRVRQNSCTSFSNSIQVSGKHFTGQFRLLILVVACCVEAPWLSTVLNMLEDIIHQCHVIKCSVLKGLPSLNWTLWLLRDVCCRDKGYFLQSIGGLVGVLKRVYQIMPHLLLN